MRQIDLNNPDSWDDQDKAYLRDRLEKVPDEHRHLLVERQQVFSPANEAQSEEMVRLQKFLEENYPDEMEAQDDTPVGVAIRLLSDDVETEMVEEDDYDAWKVGELRAEAGKRTDPSIPNADTMTKAQTIAALREWDAAKASA